MKKYNKTAARDHDRSDLTGGVVSNRKSLPSKALLSLPTLLVMLGTSAFGAPVDSDHAARATATFISNMYPAGPKATVKTATVVGKSRLGIEKIEPLTESGKTIGYVATLSPSGYVLLAADDEAPPIKMHSDRGSFATLPPAIQRVMRLELAEDLQTLASPGRQKTARTSRFAANWTALAAPQLDAPQSAALTPATAGNVLLTTTWDQGDPYNIYCPTAPGGPAGRAWTGCNATAMAQIMRYWRHPVAIAKDHTYNDPWGSCTGTHSCSDAGLGVYDWADMPTSVSSTDSNVRKIAVGQLMYHAGVVMQSDYESGGTSATAYWISGNFKDYFNYSAGPQEDQSSYTDVEWYNKIAADIDASRPICYAMWAKGGTDGHTLVCDGYTNGNQIHLNFGWSGGADGWYNIDTVSAGGYTWTVHSATFGIAPNYTYVDGTYKGGGADGSQAKPFPTVALAMQTATEPPTIRIAAGDYPETPTLSRTARLEAYNGVVTIGR